MDTKEKPVGEKIQDSIQSKDEPLGKKSPEAPFAIVGLTYPLVLTVMLVAIALFYYFVLR
ncbi:hypothetical protein [Aporhodopirellula aestuarii]|uniref:Uncharacterized protein n=1 Tax=Aporhodopirellula aestuarii TaxID=2950107 RepID=A0ABT0TY77_9BACT|nr:hypothetical protein [Aporhodopirellula aestuarii]MCM2369552.1 hypothetical protein [Aporhodopirellula aestuarii]